MHFRFFYMKVIFLVVTVVHIIILQRLDLQVGLLFYILVFTNTDSRSLGTSEDNLTISLTI